jgi:hypothetical protein
MSRELDIADSSLETDLMAIEESFGALRDEEPAAERGPDARMHDQRPTA